MDEAESHGVELRLSRGVDDNADVRRVELVGRGDPIVLFAPDSKKNPTSHCGFPRGPALTVLWLRAVAAAKANHDPPQLRGHHGSPAYMLWNAVKRHPGKWVEAIREGLGLLRGVDAGKVKGGAEQWRFSICAHEAAKITVRDGHDVIESDAELLKLAAFIECQFFRQVSHIPGDRRRLEFKGPIEHEPFVCSDNGSLGTWSWPDQEPRTSKVDDERLGRLEREIGRIAEYASGRRDSIVFEARALGLLIERECGPEPGVTAAAFRRYLQSLHDLVTLEGPLEVQSTSCLECVSMIVRRFEHHCLRPAFSIPAELDRRKVPADAGEFASQLAAVEAVGAEVEFAAGWGLPHPEFVVAETEDKPLDLEVHGRRLLTGGDVGLGSYEAQGVRQLIADAGAALRAESSRRLHDDSKLDPAPHRYALARANASELGEEIRPALARLRRRRVLDIYKLSEDSRSAESLAAVKDLQVDVMEVYEKMERRRQACFPEVAPIINFAPRN